MFTKKIAGAALVSLGLTLAASGAMAQPANTQTCLQLSHQLSDALDSHQQSDNYKAARDEQSVGKTACMSGMFKEGAAHYTAALQLLGVSSTMAQAGQQTQTP
jgi:hypothetical protein